MTLRLLRSSCTIRVLHTTWISDVDSVVFVNRIKKMVSFELSKEIEKDGFRRVRILNHVHNLHGYILLNSLKYTLAI